MSGDVRVKIDSAKSPKFNELNEDMSSIFYKKGQTTIFIAAACIGFYFKERIPLPPGKASGDLFITSTLGSGNSTKLWILKSIGMADSGINSLKDFKSTMKVCQEYANYGIDYLYNIHRESDDEIGELFRKMNDVLEEELDSC